MSLTKIAEETLRITDQGTYVPLSGREVSIRDAVAHAVQGTVLVRPGDFAHLTRPEPVSSYTIEVTSEKTGDAARRLVELEGVRNVFALNFASAVNPGGGFLTGAKAQEEDLARCSALYACLLKWPEYYEVNRKVLSPLYTDHFLYSPEVPFFRNERYDLLERPFPVSVLTAPAPNAKQLPVKDPEVALKLREVLFDRALKVLQMAAHHGHRTLILGAWGCGAFRNNPRDAAEAFARGLETMQGAFSRVVFAVYERDGQGPNLRTFRERFG
ncbi:TIGR02452 family protein [Corallococcus praedator]|uniref:TIGR02452 family protein n=1 Tax=Corallococcus praedator TaxID=2316724 RepID=A0ABX9QIS5_9BACT|nr:MULTISPECIES: TIGR02452 family protein [Corallococcus]RKH30101.1 TIGR02452 family protein [Corallococcus sp. CA031C]RKI09108.1 TIGR02452 family protein [Corallococcus praedator]